MPTFIFSTMSIFAALLLVGGEAADSPDVPSIRNSRAKLWPGSSTLTVTEIPTETTDLDEDEYTDADYTTEDVSETLFTDADTNFTRSGFKSTGLALTFGETATTAPPTPLSTTTTATTTKASVVRQSVVKVTSTMAPSSSIANPPTGTRFQQSTKGTFKVTDSTIVPIDEVTENEVSGIASITLRGSSQDAVEGSGAGSSATYLGRGVTSNAMVDTDTEDDADTDQDASVEGSGSSSPFVPRRMSAGRPASRVEGSGDRGGITDDVTVFDKPRDMDSPGKQVSTTTTSNDIVFSTPDMGGKNNNDIPGNYVTPTEDEDDELLDLPNDPPFVSKQPNSTQNLLAQPAMLAAVIGGAVIGLLCAILLVMYLVYRMRKKDEGSYALEEPSKRPGRGEYMRAPTNSGKEFYA